MATLHTFDDNESSAEFSFRSYTTLIVSGTIGGGTLSILTGATAGTLVTAETISQAGVVAVNLAGSYRLKLTLAGATTPNLLVESTVAPAT
jgi:hypothetical protein